ncbi:beta-1,4-mannosyl-glycoprotein beta-1,4-N-acetylglucosaminyltransferase [Burkholderia ubonensis]|uniref:beta-1,4-mannosyl-glycoprotein beta-1,4-N-acetylglucosaminyltransferase n=1 Tax=Burkholderia ubonensis TaxID=101571 RepID=UPI00075AA8D9|nr:beta-1,4-mannosyl-glycoprotein beta-1,4-N-acetylglucosaminyltransferase [Burkholderia ubonensis]KVO53166.1 beta-1,4-mannosyl-glycoprotein beta-1,4-N-acetylglucosaminyltransferase [Burkholderia ubonensis]KVX28030.1 beta-1,4-mannosyl-glycoprotein beta-1,4-N-acetylglucosaminyltransferase [Burkholderia ubonensis]KVZ00164.1 beta-1,4-mannosyl-glycoprotein beta-1,4-N-acetylglucosaminyltransferase [Burkholderia ubonensis]KWI93396.1 beta-1,4-mannosyl-glycoprotein beta-1,4-N-acetylglucosaminyltransfer
MSNTTAPKVYDCFCYFNEDMLLELRMEILWDHVDYFVIAESRYTQVGDPKPLNFDIRRFERFKDKIRYLEVDHLPPGPPDYWKNENYQRSYLINGLHDARPDDLILVSDLDEIPRPECIRLYDPSRYLRADLHQYCYAYFLNNRLLENDGFADWIGTRITTLRHLKQFFNNVNAVRSYKSSGLLRSLKRSWFRKYRVQHLRDAGWHFSWVTSPEMMIVKMKSIADQKFVKPEFQDQQFIESRIRSGKDVLDRPLRYAPQPVEAPQFPTQITGARDKYATWLIEPAAH